jgi:cholesterol transport system auxiliary component
MSRNILYLEKEFAQNRYANSKWSDTPNKMLASLFHSCINKSSVFKSVLPSYSRGKADLLLESTLLDFYHHVNSDGSSEGIVRIEFYLIESKSGEVVATIELDSKINSKTLDVNGGVRALNDASKSVALSLTQWLSSLDD